MNKCTRIIALLLALCLMGGALSACDLIPGSDPAEDNRSYVSVAGMSFSYSPYYTPVASRWAYAQLNERQQRLYDLLLGQVYTISAEPGDLGKYPMKPVKAPGQLSIVEMRITLRALSDDNPYLFWLSQTFSHLANLDENYTLVYAFSEFSPGAVGMMTSRIDAVIGGFYADVPSGLDAYDREKLVHDYVLECCVYDTEAAAITEATERAFRAHSVYGALADHLCVCEGYGKTMQLLLNGLGVECVTLTGMSDASDFGGEQLHLWDAVLLDGSWYHVDPTWDDQEAALRRYLYFNLSDDQLAEDHNLSRTPDEVDEAVIADGGTEDMNLFIPVCTRVDYNYYVYERPHLTAYDSGEVQEGLYQAALDMADHYSFYIDPAYLNYDTAVRKLFKNSPQYFFRYVEYANSRLYDYEIDSSNLTYYPDASRSCVTVTLKYY